MINKINFCGKVYFKNPVNKFSRKNEIEEIKTFADVHDCDIVILSRIAYSHDKGVYDAIVIKQDKENNQNLFGETTFDFFKEPEIQLKKLPSFDYIC